MCKATTNERLQQELVNRATAREAPQGLRAQPVQIPGAAGERRNARRPGADPWVRAGALKSLSGGSRYQMGGTESSSQMLMFFTWL